MEIYISINGVLRNFIQKFDYHYRDYYLETEPNETDDTEIFEYKIDHPIHNDNLLDHYRFQSKEEYEHFCYIEYALELFGHSGISYQNVMSDLNKIIHEDKNNNFTIIGIDELGKARPSTLFFLSKNGFMGKNIKFIKSVDIDREWKKCDMWITDSKEIIQKCPNKKIAVKFITLYNDHFSHSNEITKLTQINELCMKYLEKPTTSILIKLSGFVGQIMNMKNLLMKKI